MLKGQSQLLIVIGILVFVIVVVLFATNTINLLPPEPKEISQLKGALKVEVDQKLRADAFEVVKKVSEQGGYWLSSEQPQSVSYKGADVAYWRLGNQNLARTRQQVAAEIARGLRESVSSLNPGDLSSKIGKTVVVGPVQAADVVIKDDEVTLKINIPITLEGYPLQNPLEISVPTKLGQALDFANDLIEKETRSNDDLESKPFEKALAVSLVSYQSLGIDGGPKVPTMGVLEGCGKSFHRDWFSVKPEMEDLLQGALTNTFTAGRYVENIADKSRYPATVLPVYTNMKAKFSLGEGLNENNFQMAPNPVEVKTSVPSYVSVCISNPYRVDYWLLLPIVAELKDEDFKFQFAFHVFLVGYEPGKDDDLQVNLDGWKEQLLTCKNALCDAKIKVADGTGPVELASVSYSGCNLGLTNTEGVLESKVPCGISLLEVSKGGYTQFKDLYSSEELKDKNIYLTSKKIPTVKINLYNIILQENNGKYTVKDVKLNDKETTIAIASENKQTGITFLEQTTKPFLATDIVPSGIVDLSVIVRDGRKTLGGLLLPYYISSYDQEIWLYSPITETGLISQKTDGADQASEEGSYVFALTNVSVQCGLKLGQTLPISNYPVDIATIKGCVV